MKYIQFEYRLVSSPEEVALIITGETIVQQNLQTQQRVGGTESVFMLAFKQTEIIDYSRLKVRTS